MLVAVGILTLSAEAWGLKNPARTTDSNLAGKVRGALYASFGNAAREIAVTAQDGYVFLHGEVGSEFVRARAERIAAGVAGVRSVSNELALEPRP
jgi:osmotically-inducible protein OsmY